MEKIAQPRLRIDKSAHKQDCAQQRLHSAPPSRIAGESHIAGDADIAATEAPHGQATNWKTNSSIIFHIWVSIYSY